MGREDPRKIRAAFSNLLLPPAWRVLSSSSPMLALRSYSSQLCGASSEPSVWLSLWSMAMERLPLGGTWKRGLRCTAHSRALRKVRAISPHVPHTGMPMRSLSAWELMFKPIHVCGDHEAPLAFPLPAWQMKGMKADEGSGFSRRPLRSNLAPVFVFLPVSILLLSPLQAAAPPPDAAQDPNSGPPYPRLFSFPPCYEFFSLSCKDSVLSTAGCSHPSCLCLGLHRCCTTAANVHVSRTPLQEHGVHHCRSKPQPASIQDHLCYQHDPPWQFQRRPSTDQTNTNDSRTCPLIKHGPESSFLPNSSHASPCRTLPSQEQ